MAGLPGVLGWVRRPSLMVGRGKEALSEGGMGREAFLEGLE